MGKAATYEHLPDRKLKAGVHSGTSVEHCMTYIWEEVWDLVAENQPAHREDLPEAGWWC